MGLAAHQLKLPSFRATNPSKQPQIIEIAQVQQDKNRLANPEMRRLKNIDRWSSHCSICFVLNNFSHASCLAFRYDTLLGAVTYP